MISRRPSWRAVLSAHLAALMLASGVLVPLIERADLGHEAVVESQHDPDRCPTPHDHTVCVLSNAGTASPAPLDVSVGTPASEWVPPPPPRSERGWSSSFLRVPARAPPTV